MIKRWKVKWDETEIPDGYYVREVDYDNLLRVLVAVCERGDTDHSAKSMYWIASDALKAAGYDSNGNATKSTSEPT